MIPLLMGLSSVQSLIHDSRTRFAPRFVDMADGVEQHPLMPTGVIARLTAWMGRRSSIKREIVQGGDSLIENEAVPQVGRPT